MNYLVDTTDEGIVKSRMSKSKLRQVRKAMESGAEIIEPENVDQVKEFYNILFNLYKYSVKKPLPPGLFSKLLYQSI